MLQKSLFVKTRAIKYTSSIIVIFIIAVLFASFFLSYSIKAVPKRDNEIRSAIDEILSSNDFSGRNGQKSVVKESVKSLMERIDEFLESLESEEDKTNTQRFKSRYSYNNSSWNSFVNKFIIIIAIIVLLALIFFIIKKLFENYNQTKMINYDMYEDILFELKEPDEIFDTAIKKYKEGRYRESLRLLYLSIIVYLNRKDFVRIDKAKTNRQYVNELYNNGYEHLDLFKKFTMSFNIHWYGAVSINRNEMEYWLGEYNRLTQEED